MTSQTEAGDRYGMHTCSHASCGSSYGSRSASAPELQSLESAEPQSVDFEISLQTVLVMAKSHMYDNAIQILQRAIWSERATPQHAWARRASEQFRAAGMCWLQAAGMATTLEDRQRSMELAMHCLQLAAQLQPPSMPPEGLSSWQGGAAPWSPPASAYQPEPIPAASVTPVEVSCWTPHMPG